MLLKICKHPKSLSRYYRRRPYLHISKVYSIVSRSRVRYTPRSVFCTLRNKYRIINNKRHDTTWIHMSSFLDVHEHSLIFVRLKYVRTPSQSMGLNRPEAECRSSTGANFQLGQHWPIAIAPPLRRSPPPTLQPMQPHKKSTDPHDSERSPSKFQRIRTYGPGVEGFRPEILRRLTREIYLHIICIQMVMR